MRCLCDPWVYKVASPSLVLRIKSSTPLQILSAINTSKFVLKNNCPIWEKDEWNCRDSNPNLQLNTSHREISSLQVGSTNGPTFWKNAEPTPLPQDAEILSRHSPNLVEGFCLKTDGAVIAQTQVTHEQCFLLESLGKVNYRPDMVAGRVSITPMENGKWRKQ